MNPSLQYSSHSSNPLQLTAPLQGIQNKKHNRLSANTEKKCRAHNKKSSARAAPFPSQQTPTSQSLLLSQSPRRRSRISISRRGFCLSLGLSSAQHPTPCPLPRPISSSAFATTQSALFAIIQFIFYFLTYFSFDGVAETTKKETIKKKE